MQEPKRSTAPAPCPLRGPSTQESLASLAYPSRTHLRAGSCSVAQPEQAQGGGPLRGPQPLTRWFSSPRLRHHPPPPPCCVGGVCAASSGWPDAAGLSCEGPGCAPSHRWQPGPVCPSPQGHCPRGPPLLAGVAPDCHCHSSLSSGTQQGHGWRPWGGVDQTVRSEGHQVSPNSPCHPYRGQPPCPTFQEPTSKSMERQTEVTQGMWGKEEPRPQMGQPTRGSVDLSGVRVGCAGRARPEAYPVLGEEPCLDTAYVLGMAGPAWCSRCGPPSGRERRRGRGRGGKRMRRSRRNRAQDGEKRGGRGERRKKVGKDGQIDRQTAQKGRLTTPLPTPTQHPRPWLAAPGLSFGQRWAPKNRGSWITASGAGTSAQSEGHPCSQTPPSGPKWACREEPKKGSTDHKGQRQARQCTRWH